MVKILDVASSLRSICKTCKNYQSCTNCRGHHFAYSRECTRWQMENRVQQVIVEKRLSFHDARKLVETTQPPVVATSYAAVVKPTRSVSVNTDLTWRNNETQTKPNQKQREIAPKLKQACTATISTTMYQVSLDSNNPSSRSSTRVLVPSLPLTRKDKSPSKDRCSRRTTKAEQNAIKTSNMFDVLDGGRGGGGGECDEMDIPTTKPQSKFQIIHILPP